MNFYDLFLDESDHKLSLIPDYHYDYNNIDVKKINKYLKNNNDKELTLFFVPEELNEIDSFLTKGISPKNVNQNIVLYSYFTAAKIYSGINNKKRGFIIKVDVKLNKISINKERINEVRVVYPNIGNTISESLIGANSIKHKGKIYFEKIKSIIYIDNEKDETIEFKMNSENKNKSIKKIKDLVEKLSVSD